MDDPGQTVVSFPASKFGTSNTIIETESIIGQFWLSVAVTVYTVEFVGLAVGKGVVGLFKEFEGLHK